MPASVAGIALPEGNPEAIFDAARELHSIAGAFESGGGVVGSGVAQVGSWQGQASESFRALAGSYEQAAGSSAAVLHDMAGAVRAYGREFRDAYERVKRLQEQAEECLREIELWEARRDDAAWREGAARTRATQALLSAPADLTGSSFVAQADAMAEADAAAGERAEAERRLGELRERLQELRREGEQERDRALQAERRAAAQVLSSVDGLPAVGMPGGAAGGAGPAGLSPAMSMVPAAYRGGAGSKPAVYRGGASTEHAVYRGGARAHFADFTLGDILDFTRDVDRELGPVDEAINEGVEKAGAFGREMSGINDAERSWDAFGRGDIFGGLFYGALASPFGRYGKVGKEAVEEGAEQLAKRAAKKGISDEESLEIATRAREAGLTIVNGKLAGKTHPVTGVPYRQSGFPDFTQYADDAAKQLGRDTTVKVDGITGNRRLDFALANKEAGFARTPKGYTWHHVEDCRHMQLVPTTVHRPTSHSGCVQLIQAGVVKP
jgi:hypothetical protein